MNYNALEELVGIFLQEQGTKPAGDWARWTQTRRRAAITWAEKLAAKYLPDEDKSVLIADYSALIGTVVTANVKSTINFSSFGPRVFKVRNLFATVDGRRKDFMPLETPDERMLANLNRSSGYWWLWRSGGITIYHPATLANMTLAMTALNYPPSHNDLYLYFTLGAYVLPTVGLVITQAVSGASGTITEIGNIAAGLYWCRYTLTSGTFNSTDVFTGAGGKGGTVTHASSAFGVDICPFLGNEEQIAKGAAGWLLEHSGDRKASLLSPDFYTWLKITERQAQDGR